MPGGRFGCALEVERRHSATGPGALNGIAVGAELAFVAGAKVGVGEFKVQSLQDERSYGEAIQPCGSLIDAVKNCAPAAVVALADPQDKSQVPARRAPFQGSLPVAGNVLSVHGAGR